MILTRDIGGRVAEKEQAHLKLSRSLRDPPSQQNARPAKVRCGRVEHADPAGEHVRRTPAIRERQLVTAFDKALRDGKVSAGLRDQMGERTAAEGARRAGQGERFNVRAHDINASRAKPETPKIGPQNVADRERSR